MPRPRSQIPDTSGATAQDILDLATTNNVRFLRLQFTDILGINNRDLGTMGVDLDTTRTILSARHKDRPVIAMSGVETRDQVKSMRRAGADAVLVGTSIMAHPNPARKLEELENG